MSANVSRSGPKESRERAEDPDGSEKEREAPTKKRAILSRLFGSQRRLESGKQAGAEAAGSVGTERARKRPSSIDAESAAQGQAKEPGSSRGSLSARLLSFFSRAKPPMPLPQGKTTQPRISLDATKMLRHLRPTYYTKNLEFLFRLKEDNRLSKLYKQNFHNNWLSLRYGAGVVRKSEEMLAETLEISGSPTPHPLPRGKGGMTVVFDLDGTLVSCCDKSQGDFSVVIEYRGRKIQANFLLRPHASQVLASLAKKYEVVLFSSSHGSYVDAVAKQLDPSGQIFSAIYSRRDCLAVGDTLIKSLVRVGRDPSRVLLIDDNAKSFLRDTDNAVPIIPFVEGGDDIELLTLEGYIDWVAQSKDVRQANSQYFGWRFYRTAKNLQELYFHLFPHSLKGK